MGYLRPLSQTKFFNDANLVSYWKLDGNSNDSKGSNNGIDTNIAYSASYAVNTNFIQGMNVTSQASGSGISVGNAVALRTTGDLTISLWFYLTSDAETSFFSGGGQAGSPYNNYVLWYFPTQGILWRIRDNAGGLPVNIVVPFSTTNRWVHLTGTISGTSAVCYVDGVKAGSGTFTGTRNSLTNNNIIGGGYCDSVERIMDGYIDDVSFFSRALSAGEVAELYQSMTLGEYLPNSNTKLLLHLNGSSADSSGNSNNGTDTAITYSQANGKFGQGAGFNGSSSYIKGLYDLGILFSSSYTMGFWVKLNGEIGSGNWAILNLNHASGGADTSIIRYEYNSGTRRLKFIRYNSGAVDDEPLYNITLGTTNWYHLIAVYNSSTTRMDLYLNGVSVTNTTSATTAGSTGFYTRGYSVGADIGGGSLGNIMADEVIIENRAWSASEVSKYYTFSKGRFGII